MNSMFHQTIGKLSDWKSPDFKQYARLRVSGIECWAQVQKNGFALLNGGPGSALAGTTIRRASLLAPCIPGKIIGIGLNYKGHVSEMGHGKVPQEPVIFLKPPSALNRPGGTIRIRAQMGRVDHEAELAVIIGRRAHRVSRDNAMRHVAGLCCFNDVTARDLQKKDGQWVRAKGFDTFAPTGPYLCRGDWHNRRIIARVNGHVRQDGNTSEMIRDIPELVSFASRVMTLDAGDIIATGTPPGIGPVKHGDRVEIQIEGMGVLANPVREAAEQGEY